MLLVKKRRDLGILKWCYVERTVGGVEVGRENRFWGVGVFFLPGFSGLSFLDTVQAGLGSSSLRWFPPM